MVAVLAAALGGWLCLYLILLAGPQRARPRTARPEVVPSGRHDEPPAVVSLVARRLRAYGYPATLLDLSARGWFWLNPPAPGAAGPVMCVLPTQPPGDDALMPYERRVVAHIGVRAGVAGSLPAQAMSEGFTGGEEVFMKQFRAEVIADARGRGLTRPRLSTRRKLMLAAFALIPAAAALPFRTGNGHWLPLPCYVVLLILILAVRSERPTPAGQAALAYWRRGAASEQPGLDRSRAYAAAFGRLPAAVAVFASGDRNRMWTSYGGQWRRIPIGVPGSRKLDWTILAWMIMASTTISVIVLRMLPVLIGSARGSVEAAAVAVALIGGSTFYVTGKIARYNRIPRFTEFDGQVMKQWERSNGEDTDYCVAIDDGRRPSAWAFIVEHATHLQLTPGMLVHVQVNERRNIPISIQVVEPAPVAPMLAAARPAPVPPPPAPAAWPAPAQPTAAVTLPAAVLPAAVLPAALPPEAPATVPGLAPGVPPLAASAGPQVPRCSLPNPADLVTASEAAEILGCQVRQGLAGLGGGFIWRPVVPPGPTMRVEVRGSQDAQHWTDGGVPVPGADGCLLPGRAAMAYAGPLAARITVDGDVPDGTDAALTRLVPRVADRLRQAAG
jgi:hypothetical protein